MYFVSFKVGDQNSLDCLGNGKKSIALNLKHKDGVHIFRKLCNRSDVLLEPFRPGVMESLGLGPNELLKDNPKLIYARLSGFGQSGYYSKRAGHDINYVAVSGILSMLGRANEKPFPPINALADFGGGGLMCALGILMALFERTNSGKGQIVDCSMVEGTAYLCSWLYRSQIHPLWGNKRGENILDSGAHFYEVYETKDGKYMSVGAIEPQFYKMFLKGLGLSSKEIVQFGDFDESKKIIAAKFLEKTQKEWCNIFDSIDACVTPILSLTDAPKHQHNVDSNSFVPCSDQENLIPAPAPKLSRTPAKSQALLPQINIGQHTEEILKSMKYSNKDIEEFEKNGCVQISRKSKI